MPRKKQTPLNPKTTAIETLALSDLHLRAIALEEEHQWLLKQIKKKRTELNNFVNQMRSVATQMFHRVTPVFDKLNQIDQEIHRLFDEILKTRKLGVQSKQSIQEIYRTLQMSGLISHQELEDEDSELDELFESFGQEEFAQRPPRNDYQQGEIPAKREIANPEDAKKIRQTFLKLAAIFHPDKVMDSETQMHHTEIMKELNKAYQEGDLARLIEIEQQHLAGETVEDLGEDDLTRKCKKLQQQNTVLKNQYESLKRELRLVKNTPEGDLVSEYRRATKAGIDPTAQMISEVEKQMEIVEDVRNFVRDFRDRKITIKEFLRGPTALRRMSQALQEKILEELFGIHIHDIMNS